MGGDWKDQFADAPDVLKRTPDDRTVVWAGPVPIGGEDFVTMAGPCSVETEHQLMETAVRVAAAGRAFCAAERSSRGHRRMRSRAWALKG